MSEKIRMSPDQELEEMAIWISTEVGELQKNSEGKGHRWLSDYDDLLDDMEEFLNFLDLGKKPNQDFESLINRSQQLKERP
jgi:hypothetical protein